MDPFTWSVENLDSSNCIIRFNQDFYFEKHLKKTQKVTWSESHSGWIINKLFFPTICNSILRVFPEWKFIDKRMGCVVSNEIKNVIEDTFTPSEHSIDKVESYAKAVDMNEANKKILHIAVKDGWETATKTMMETANNDYSTMRLMYG